MKVYSDTGYGNGTLLIAPGNHHPEVDEWISKFNNDEGREIRKPTMLRVKFDAGAADVADNLGKYLVKHGLAKRHPVLFAAPAAR